jgi:hypothetical protein
MPAPETAVGGRRRRVATAAALKKPAAATPTGSVIGPSGETTGCGSTVTTAPAATGLSRDSRRSP